MPSKGIPKTFSLRYFSALKAALLDPVLHQINLLKPWEASSTAAVAAKLQQVSTAVDLGAINRLIADQASAVSSWQHGLLARQVETVLGVDIRLLLRTDIRADSIDVVYSDFVAENVALIKSIPAGLLSDVERVIIGAYANGVRNQELAMLVKQRYGVSESSAMRIAVDQTGKLNGRISMAQHIELGCAGFVWRTMRDGAVRPAHRPLEGMHFSYPNPSRKPGQEVRCRCYPEPDFSSILNAL